MLITSGSLLAEGSKLHLVSLKKVLVISPCVCERSTLGHYAFSSAFKGQSSVTSSVRDGGEGRDEEARRHNQRKNEILCQRLT